MEVIALRTTFPPFFLVLLSVVGMTRSSFVYCRSRIMITSEYVLELSNVFHSGQVEAGSCLQKMIGTVRTGVILKDVSMEVHGGELSAVLGSKGAFARVPEVTEPLQCVCVP